MTRRLLNLLTLLSALLCVAVVVLWMFSAPGDYVIELGFGPTRWRLTTEARGLTLDDRPRGLAEVKESGRLLSQWAESNRRLLEPLEAELEMARLLAMSDPWRSAAEFEQVARAAGLPPPPALKTPRPLVQHTIRYGMLLSVAAALPAARLAWLGLGRRQRLARRRRAAGLCPACGYDLRATRDRCPECGGTRSQK
jgi:hypothetical protein